MSGGGDLVTSFRRFISREGLIQPDDRLLLAVSGGIDSTVLAYLLKEEGYPLSVVHCNFQLRGEDSDEDEAFVRELAALLDVRFFSRRFDLSRDRQVGESTQMAARRLRYLYFGKLLDEYNFSALVTAHHLNDSFETMLLNLLRGTGLAGLRGISPRTDFVAVRPLLESTREEIEDYASSRGIEWREDRSNASDDYARNRIRHHLVPQFLKTHGMSPDGLAATLSNLRSAHRFYEQGLSLAVHPYLTPHGEGFTFARDECPLGLADTITLLRHHTGYMGFGRDDYENMLAAPGFREVYSDDYVARVSAQGIDFLPRPADTAGTYHIEELPFHLSLPDLVIEISVVARPATLNCDDTLFCRLPGFPLDLRPRGKGDRFQPLGMQGTKKVKDFLGDEKVAPWIRRQTRLLTTADEKVVAVIPFRTDERFAVRGMEERVLRIHWQTKTPDRAVGGPGFRGLV